MPKKLTILGVLTALVFGALNFFQGSASAEIQTFAPLPALVAVDTATCYFGAYPTSATPITCGPGSSMTNIDSTANGVGTPVTLYSVIRLDSGSRLTLPITFTHPAFYGADPAMGTVTGDVTAATDLLCSGGAPDILANPAADAYPGFGSTPAGAGWPDLPAFAGDPGFNGFDFTRIADFNDPLPAADAYVDAIRPQPASWPLASSDLATLTHLYLASAALFPLPSPTKLNLATTLSPYGLLYRSSVALLGGDPDTPPQDDYICLDSPQHSVGVTLPGAGLIVPPNGDYVRWTNFTSAIDVVGGEVARILDAQCVRVSAGGLGAPACDMTDADGDLVPASVEAAMGAAAGSDGDADGANDYQELFEFTNPAGSVACAIAQPALDIDPVTPGIQSSPFNDSNDTDCDGSKDKRDNGADEDAPATSPVVLDTTADDNCPADFNPLQENADYEKSLAGPGPGAQTDGTNPDQDADGDACDTDDDNDGLNDFAEGVLTIVGWSGNTDTDGAGPLDTTVCKGTAVGAAPAVVMNPLDADSDDDIFLDGIECQQSSRPDLADPAIGSCTTAPVDPDGCALQKPAPAGGDPDQPAPVGDKLYHPTAAAGHGAVEAFYRTRQINLPAGGQGHDTDGDTFAGDNDKDADGDKIEDGPEVWSYGTAPSNPDTDGDKCSDSKEAADNNGDRTVNAADLGRTAAAATYGFGAYRAVNGTITLLIWKKNADFNRNANINAQDLGLQASVFGGCNTPPGPANQAGRVITNQLAP